MVNWFDWHKVGQIKMGCLGVEVQSVFKVGL